MKTTVLALICMMFFSCSNKYKHIINKSEEYNIIPKPQSLKVAKGKFLVNSSTTVVGSIELANEGEYLVGLLKNTIGGIAPFSPGDQGDIIVKLDTTLKDNEAYTLTVNYDKIVIAGKTAKGVFYGIQSLRQLMPVAIENHNDNLKEFTIPAVVIEDAPRFGYRGMQLDVARHFYSVDFIKKYIDLLAMHKMNKFHWHLTEDQGWRIEIKKYPMLTEVGSKRYGTIIGHHPGTANDEKEYGGFYTQEEVKDIVKYAAERHITVIPEIELPGHASAAIASYPYLSCFPQEPTVVTKNMGSKVGKAVQANGTPKIVQETWGVFNDVFCAGQEETFKFLQDVLDEVIPLFPSEYIHIGGDECPKANWKKCPNCQKIIKENNLADEHELQSYFIQRIEKYLNSKGKKIIGWDEILEGGLAPNATVMSWRGEKGGIEAAKQNHDVIMTPNHSCYFDHYQTKDKENEPIAIGGKTTVEDVYAYNPIPKELTEEEQKFILGAQGNVWTEYMNTTDYVEYMILPRMTALSEVVWTDFNLKDWNDFKLRLNTLKERYEALELNYAKHVFEEE